MVARNQSFANMLARHIHIHLFACLLLRRLAHPIIIIVWGPFELV
jgi:hypothetical protein